MEGVEKIEVREIYILGAVKFGLLFGLIVGFIIAVVVMSLGFAGSALVKNVPTGTSSILLFSGLTFAYFFGGTFIFSILFALLYNLSSLLGGRINLGLIEKPVSSGKESSGVGVVDKSVGKSVGSSKPVYLGGDKPANG